MSRRQQLQAAATRIDATTIASAVAAAKHGDVEGRIALAGVAAWAAYACPQAVSAVWDNIATAWLGRGPSPEIPAGLPEAPLEGSFWEAFWQVVDGHDEGYDAISITVAVASLAGSVDPQYGELAEQHVKEHWGARTDITNAIPD